MADDTEHQYKWWALEMFFIPPLHDGKQYNLVPVNRWWRSEAGKVWQHTGYVSDLVVYA